MLFPVSGPMADIIHISIKELLSVHQYYVWWIRLSLMKG
jgi:hypothetical protein